MHIKSLVSPLALAVALSFSGAASAQTMVGGVEVSAEDLPEVQSLCNSLAAGTNESLAETTDTASDDDDSDDSDAGAGDGDDGDDGDGDGDDGNDAGAGGDDGQADPDPAADDGAASDMDNALTTIDLDTITVDQCREAGLIQ